MIKLAHVSRANLPPPFPLNYILVCMLVLDRYDPGLLLTWLYIGFVGLSVVNYVLHSIMSDPVDVMKHLFPLKLKD